MLYKYVKWCCKKIFVMDYHSTNLKTKRYYEESVNALNGLISNVNVISRGRAVNSKTHLDQIPKTRIYCQRTGILMSDIDRLKIIHVAGTKGKGSTCAYIEAILRNNGMKTGLFTSPHLKEVRERIKINGTPLSQEKFSDYFWNIYDNLTAAKTEPNDMPFYFQFLTIMAFDVFLKEKVDFVILETGIGGRFDNTNVISNPTIVCITSLGFDHMDLLGSTMSEIAWNKAGIIKSGSVVFTCDDQPKEGLDVIKNEVKATNSSLYLVPTSERKMLEIIDKKICVHQCNALLASAICLKILDRDFVPFVNDSGSSNNIFKISPDFCLLEEHKQIIHSTPISGRYQLINKSFIDYYIDGAHTGESIMTSIEWFKEITKYRYYDKRFLIFMTTGNRSTENFLSQLMVLKFDGILLSPLNPFTDKEICDFAMNPTLAEMEKVRLTEIGSIWKQYTSTLQENGKETIIEYFQSFSDIVQWLSALQKPTQVLVVGSLRLTACALAVLT